MIVLAKTIIQGASGGTIEPIVVVCPFSVDSSFLLGLLSIYSILSKSVVVHLTASTSNIKQIGDLKDLGQILAL